MFSLAVVLFFATLGSPGMGFGVLTSCTNTYDCSITSCSPCRTALNWSEIGWATQGVLLLVGVMLAFLGALRIVQRSFRISALLLGPVSVLLFVVTTALAVSSF